MVELVSHKPLFSMTREEFNLKYKQWIPEGWFGLEFDEPKVTEYLDKEMQDLIMIPGFELHQIKLKFDWPRFYFTTNFKNKGTELAIAMRIQEDVNKIRRGYDHFNTAKLRVEANSPYNDGWTREHYEKEYKLSSRMDIIGQNGNEGTHYVEDWMDKEYKQGYEATVTSGMFFEWYPNLTGVWEQDKEAFVQEMKQIEAKLNK